MQKKKEMRKQDMKNQEKQKLIERNAKPTGINSIENGHLKNKLS